jgi:hypothetical protein
MKITSYYPEDSYEGVMRLSLQTDSVNQSVSFGRGEPEDNALCRDLSDAYSIEGMLVAAYNAGKNGEELIREREEEDEDEDG